MNLLNLKAAHVKFGTGIIKSNENGFIHIQFDEAIGKKVFIYPDAFEHFLKLENPGLEEEVQNEIKTKYEQIELEKERQRIELARVDEERRDQLELEKLQKKATKSSATRKAKKEKNVLV